MRARAKNVKVPTREGRYAGHQNTKRVAAPAPKPRPKVSVVKRPDGGAPRRSYWPLLRSLPAERREP